MSRTYRRKRGDKTELEWATTNYLRVSDTWIWYWEKLDPTTKEYKQAVAKYHGDYGTSHYNSRAPGWWITLTSQRPYRRDADRKIKKWLLNTEYEVIIDSKEPLPYWD